MKGQNYDGQQAQQQSRQPLHAEANLRSEHQTQHGSEVSEEADAQKIIKNIFDVMQQESCHTEKSINIVVI